jgi:proteasome lid subunit RPN8/RPN11
MAILTISRQHFQLMIAHAEQTYPHECCGLMMGKINENWDKQLVEIIPTENAWNAETSNNFEILETSQEVVTTTEHYFTISPQAMLKAQKQGRDRNLVIIGIYHSHPDHPAIPSEFDRVYAWSEYSYVIISVEKGKATDLQNWSLDDNHQFQVEELIRI